MQSKLDISNNLSKYILEHYHNYTEFANTIGISKQTLSKYLSAELRPGRRFMNRLKEHDVDLTAIFNTLQNEGTMSTDHNFSNPDGGNHDRNQSFNQNKNKFFEQEMILELKSINNNMQIMIMAIQNLTNITIELKNQNSTKTAPHDSPDNITNNTSI